MSCWEELPQELWVQILQQVTYKQRLSACSLVCQKLARAAAAATTSLDSLRFDSAQRLDGFLSWTNSHGSSLTKLCLEADVDNSAVRQLPCPNLLELELVCGHVQLCAGSEGAGLLHSCTALTRLSMVVPTLLDGEVDAPVAGVPSAVAQLQHLELTMFYAPQGSAWEKNARMLAQVLQDRLTPHLASLTCLSVSAGGSSKELGSAFNQHISTMIKLKQLHLSGTAGAIPVATLPGIERLTALEDLVLSSCGLETSRLLCMTTGLTNLHLGEVTLDPGQVQQDGESATAQLLQLLARLCSLRELRLHMVADKWPRQLSLYSALTASSDLQVLSVRDCDIPGAAWAHAFPAGRKLPCLLEFAALREDDWEPQELFSVDSTVLDRLVSCAPALGKLQIATYQGASLAPLESLTALTALTIAPVAASPAAFCSELTTLTRLQALKVTFPDLNHDEPAGLQHLVPLTALTGLTCLDVLQADEYGPVAFGDLPMLHDVALSAAPPDVWVQLLEHCAKDPAAPAWLAQLSSLARKVQQVQMVVAAAADAAGIVLPPEVAEARGEVEACLRELRELAAKWPHAQEG